MNKTKKQTNNGWKIVSQEDAATVYVFGGIAFPDEDGFMVEPEAFINDVQSLDVGSIDVRIATVGGDPIEAGRMFQSLVEHRARVRTIVDGKAYSAGSLLLQAGDERLAKPLAMIMVHGPRALLFAPQTANQLRNKADGLDDFQDVMLSAYTRHGIDEDRVRMWISGDEDHFFSPAKAVEANLIDRVIDGNDDMIAADAPEYYLVAAIGKNPKTAVNLDYQRGPTVMSEEKKTTEAPAAAVVQAAEPQQTFVASHQATVEAARQDGVRIESLRRKSIDQVFASFYDADPLNPVTALYHQCMDNPKCDELTARRMLLDQLGQASSQPIVQASVYGAEAAAAPPPRVSQHLGGSMRISQDQIDKRADGLERALAIKGGLVTDRNEINKERKGEYLAMSLIDVMGQELRSGGYSVVGMGEDIARQYLRALPVIAAGPSHGTDHLPSVLGNIANKSAMMGWEQSEETWSQWTVSGTLTNYQTHTRTNIGLLDKLNKMVENQPWEYGDAVDVKQRITGFFYGLKYSLSLQAIVNDELGELTRTMQGWGEAASATVGDAVYTALTAVNGAGLGDTLDEDSAPLFVAAHSNYVASGAGVAPAEAILNTTRAAMVAQADVNSNRKVAARPRFLLHGPSLFSTVYKLLNSQEVIATDMSNTADSTQGNRNSVQGMNLIPVEEHRFNTTEWILAASRRTVEVAGVGGPVTPRADQSPISETPGITYELSAPFGVSPLDFRGLQYNAGV